jgi:hypothetical protein
VPGRFPSVTLRLAGAVKTYVRIWIKWIIVSDSSLCTEANHVRLVWQFGSLLPEARSNDQSHLKYRLAEFRRALTLALHRRVEAWRGIYSGARSPRGLTFFLPPWTSQNSTKRFSIFTHT